MKPYSLGLMLAVLVCGWTGCTTSPVGDGPDGAALVLFRADSNVRNPAANDAYPGVRRIALRALDGQARPDAVLQLSDRLTLPPGERTLLFAAESSTGGITLSELTVVAEAGVDYFAWPEPTADRGILVALRRGAHGETLGVSTPWTPPPQDASRRR